MGPGRLVTVSGAVSGVSCCLRDVTLWLELAVPAIYADSAKHMAFGAVTFTGVAA